MSIAPALMNAPLVLVFARLSGASPWLHIQDFELDASLKLGLFPAGKWLAGLAARFEFSLLNGFDRLSTISQRMLDHLRQKGIQKRKTRLFPNWVDTSKIFPLVDENPLRLSLNLPAGQLIILYAGTMGKKQGLENLLDAARILQGQTHITFVLCGDGVMRAELEAAAQGLANVRFLPVQPGEKLNQLLNMADIHVLAQKADAADLVMPSKLSGMFASGKAVIATAEPHTELGQVVSRTGMLVPPDDSTALADAISQLASSPAMRSDLGKKGREHAVQHWDSQMLLLKFEDELQQAIK